MTARQPGGMFRAEGGMYLVLEVRCFRRQSEAKQAKRAPPAQLFGLSTDTPI